MAEPWVDGGMDHGAFDKPAPPLECLRSRCDKLAAGYSLVNLTDTPERRDTLRKKCHVMARELGMTDEDRHELSVQVVGQDGTPKWTKMTYPQLERLADYLSGAGFYLTIMRDRRAQ